VESVATVSAWRATQAGLGLSTSMPDLRSALQGNQTGAQAEGTAAPTPTSRCAYSVRRATPTPRKRWRCPSFSRAVSVAPCQPLLAGIRNQRIGVRDDAKQLCCRL
jgi:hypothetical protein